MPGERTNRSYDVAAKAYRELLRERAPDQAAELARVQSGEVAEVTGSFDHVGRVLRATGVPFTSVAPQAVEQIDWERLQVLWINCPGDGIGETALRRIAQWVREGGHLGTTDWALRHVIERAFPDKVRHNGRSIHDCVVPVEPAPGEHPLLDGFREDGRVPRWWIEASSFPCEVIDPAVRVLVRSAEVGARWGADAIVVEWDEGGGKVVHLVSHLYLQRSETRTARDREGAASYLQSLGVAAPRAAALAEEAGDLNAAELKSAFTASGLAASLLIEKKKQTGGAGR